MKFLFLARFSPEFKIVSQICRENTKQNNKTIRQKVCLAEARKFLLRSTELLVGNKTASSTRKGAAPFWEVWTLILPRRWFRRTLNSFYYHFKKKTYVFQKNKKQKKTTNSSRHWRRSLYLRDEICPPSPPERASQLSNGAGQPSDSYCSW